MTSEEVSRVTWARYWNHEISFEDLLMRLAFIHRGLNGKTK